MVTTVQRQTLNPPVSDRDHIRGNINANVILTEYGDFECPFCHAAHPIVLAILHEFTDTASLAFRNFPLSTIHPHAMRAAEAAEAAGAQGKFWPMHDTLFDHQRQLTDVDLMGYAHDLGLDLDQFESDMRLHRHESKIRADFVSGVRSGVNGTPTFFINGVRHDGPWDFDVLAEAITAADASTGAGGRISGRRK